MINSDAAIILTSNVIKQGIGIPLTEDEQFREEKFLKNISK